MAVDWYTRALVMLLVCIDHTGAILANVERYGPYFAGESWTKKKHCELTGGSQIKILKLPFCHGDNQPNGTLPAN